MNTSITKLSPRSRRYLALPFLLALPFMLAFGLAGLLWAVGAQQRGEQQRPRRVAGTENKAGNSNPVVEEVDEGDVVRVETQMVSVPAVVTSNSGRPVAGLRLDNFLLFEDGQPQKITSFGTTETPFEIALLLDTSGSTRADVELIRQAANAFINALRPGDRVAIVGFNTLQQDQSAKATVEVLSKLNEDRKALQRAIANLGSSNGTPFYDALERVCEEIFHDPPRDELRGRRAIVALTDGVDSTSDSDFATARAKLIGTGISAYFIQVNSDISYSFGRGITRS